MDRREVCIFCFSKFHVHESKGHKEICKACGAIYVWESVPDPLYLAPIACGHNKTFDEPCDECTALAMDEDEKH